MENNAEASSSSASSERTHTPVQRPRLKFDSSFEIESSPLQSPPRQRSFQERLYHSAETLSPSLYQRFKRVVNYLRGPPEKKDLSGLSHSHYYSRKSLFTRPECTDPVPFLNLNLHTGRTARSLPLEPVAIRATQPFTSPWLLLILGAAYIVAFAFFARAQFFLTPSDSFITCTSTYWEANDGCGLDGQSCTPFDNSTFDFRCPAQCKAVVLANPRTVGNAQVDLVPLIVGGGDANGTYRGDSFVCAAAVHA